MVCKDAQIAMHHVFDQQDGMLTEDLSLHLRSCASCSQHMQTLETTIHSLHELEWLEAPDSITTYVMQQIRQDSSHRPLFWQSHRFRKATVAAAVVCFAFVGGVWWSAPGQFSVINASPDAKLSITHNKVIIPSGAEYRGDLTISNGDVIVHGKVDGNVTALNGHVILASGADIKGRTEEVHAFWQLAKYYGSKMWNTIVGWF